jgi:hypothetical protein
MCAPLAKTSKRASSPAATETEPDPLPHCLIHQVLCKLIEIKKHTTGNKGRPETAIILLLHSSWRTMRFLPVGGRYCHCHTQSLANEFCLSFSGRALGALSLLNRSRIARRGTPTSITTHGAQTLGFGTVRLDVFAHQEIV